MGAQEIYDRLRTAPQHHPASVELFDDLTLQAGDIITVKSGTTSYEVPVFSQDIHWNGSAMTTVESTGNEKREPLPALRKREMNNQFVGNSRSYGYAKSAKKKQAQTDQWIEDFENTDLWVNRDTIWAVSGAYQVWTDPTTGNKHIQLKDGALLEVDRGDGVYSTVGSSYAIEQVNNEVVNVIEGSALWTQRDGITGVCGEFSVITDPQTGKKRLKIANGTGLVMTRNDAEFGVYDDGTLTAGVIATKVNGVASTHIQGENIYIGNEQSTTVIAGKCSLSDVTADYISGKIADLSVLNVKAISSSGNITCTNGVVMAPYIYLGVAGNARDMANAITALQISLSGNTYTLKKQDFNDDNWVDVGTFSRAITSWTMGWGDGKFTVKANPQDQSCWTNITQGTTTWDGNIATVPINATDSDNPNYSYATGRSISVNATSIFSAGEASGYDNCHLSGSWGSGNESNKLIIGKTKSGSANSLTYTITADASISYNSSTNKFVATGKAKVDGTEKDNDTDSSGEITIAFNSLQGSGASAYRTVSVKNGSTSIRTSGNLTDYGDGYSAGYGAGWNAACALVTKTGNVIYGPVKDKATATSGRTEAKFTANYTASKHSYTPSSYSGSSYTKETHSYTKSSHSFTQATFKTGSTEHTKYYYNSSYSGSVEYHPATDSYTPSSHSYSPSSYSGSSYTKETHSYTPSSFSWS